MKYHAELKFVERLFYNMNIPVQYLTASLSDSITNEKNLWATINRQDIVVKFKENIISTFGENTIYRIRDSYFCNFLVFLMQEEEQATYVCIGPYKLKELNELDYLSILESLNLTPEQLPILKKFYEDIPSFSDEQEILRIIYTLGEFLWENADNFSVKTIDPVVLKDFEPLLLQRDMLEHMDTLDTMDTMKHLEERYNIEAQIIQAVSQGQTHKAEILLAKLTNRQLERRCADPVRNMKNYCIIFNTILRKAAEYGAVHPLHIDSLSSKFAVKIENTVSVAALTRLQNEMIHKYCILVKNHSLKGYSPLVRKVLTRIDTDLTADLSLRAQAALLNINSSYLSTLFKKEVGMTLTDYVNNKRIEHAIFLLNTTTIQIQTIAQHCGISDVNYFTKTFKKHIGKTPKEYRDAVMPYKRATYSE